VVAEVKPQAAVVLEGIEVHGTTKHLVEVQHPKSHLQQ
jgi:hypothetical protein